MAKRNDVQISIYNLSGQMINSEKLSDLVVGTNEYKIKLTDLKVGGTFMVTIQSEGKKATQKVIIN
ncbi:MAG: T9SS type A sorting domain-containing protein [Draconibacterium sp.]|nr:T9SS type A sorting domain-containing protein [Draconibacterium sp.]